MTQQIINTGAANDGTGESLRNAFIAVNDNFTQIWAAGPVDSQVVITNNVISTNVTNLPLILAGNGTATITLDSTTIPGIDSVYDLGSPTKRFDSTYSQYFYGNGRFLTGISGGSGGGNVTFSETSPTSPSVGDVWIQSNTAVQFIYFNDNNSNQWAEMEAYQSFGSSSSGNGGNINFESVASDIIPSVTNGYSLGNAAQQWNNAWVGNTVYIKTIPLTVSNTALTFNGESVLTTSSNLRFANLSVTGNITTNAIYTNNYFYANGAPFAPGANVIPNSSIRITGNTISTATLNQNLTLAANGIGSVQTNSTIIPGIDAVYDIGTPTLRMDTVYATYFVGNGSGLTGITATASLSGNLAGNLQGNGYGANAFSFVSATGNITGNYFIGNGSLLTGLPATYGNANVVANLAALGSNPISTTGNITSGYFIGNGSLLTGISSSGNVNFSAVASNIIPTGNSVYSLGNATNQWNDLYLSNATIYMNSVPISLTAGNVLTVNGADVVTTAANGESSIGNLDILGTTISIANGAPETYINLSSSVEGWAYVQVPTDATANAYDTRIHNDAGNIEFGTGDYSTGSTNYTWKLGNDGTTQFPNNILKSQPDTRFYIDAHDIGEDYAYVAIRNYDNTGNVNSQITAATNSVILSTTGGQKTWQFDNTGNLSVPLNINFNGGGLQQVVNEDFYIRASDNESDGWSIYNVVDDGAGNTLSQTRLEYNQYTVRTDAQGASYTWAFRDSGVLDLPGDIYGNVGGNLTIKIGDQAGSNTFIDLQTRSYVGDALISNIRIANPDVTISTANAAQNWTFSSTGNLTVPGNIQSISTGFAFTSGIISIDNLSPAVITVADSTFPGVVTGRVTISEVNSPLQANGTWYYESVEANQIALYLDAGLTQPVDATGWPGYAGPGGLAVSPGYSNLTVTGGNVRIVSNFGETWTFESGGALTIPGDITSSITIDIDNRAASNTADIRLYAADDILVQGRDKPDDLESEGGDINIYAGHGSDAVTSGFDSGGGGDIQIRGGPGGADIGGGFGGSAGGFINISSGDGGAGSDTTNAGSGGSLGLSAGSAAGVANTALGGVGGGITITAGDTTRINEIGGTISLNTGSASGDGTSASGYVEINIPSSNVGPGGTWTFGGTGTTLNVPGNAEIYGASYGNFTVGCAGNTIITSSDYGSNVKNWVFGYTGNLTLPTIDLGTGLDAQAVIQSQRKLIPPFRYSAVIDGSTPTVVYNATDVNTTSMKVTMQIQHTGLGMEFFEVFATFTGADTFYTVNNRVSPPTIDASTVVVGLDVGNAMKITVTINSGAATSWVTYDAVEFGIAVD